jgi:cytochrome c oxidase subunit 2
MESPVKVVSQQDFDTWVGEQTNAAALNPADRGERLAKNQGCQSCHSVDGSRIIGPTWQGLYGAQIPLADGSTVAADDAYIVKSIKEPNSQVHQGFPPNVMQSYASTLTDEQIADIIEFIKTLK